MAEFARFTAVPNTDNAFTLPNAAGNNRKFPFDLPGLSGTPSNSTVILMFKVTMSGNVRLQMRINDNPGLSIDFTLDSPAGWRSWHEVIGPSAGVKPSSNVLSITANVGSSGAKVAVSDIVFLYHANAI